MNRRAVKTNAFKFLGCGPTVISQGSAGLHVKGDLFKIFQIIKHVPLYNNSTLMFYLLPLQIVKTNHIDFARFMCTFYS